jgi:hypothetical protein
MIAFDEVETIGKEVVVVCLKVCPGIHVEGLKETTINRITAEIETGNLPNTYQKRYHSSGK